MSKSNYVLAEEPAVDLAVLEALAAELEEYIVKDELYRTVRVNLPCRRPDGPDVGRRPADAASFVCRRALTA